MLPEISNEPDDEESMMRLPVYSNEYQVEGLIATTFTYLRKNRRLDLIERQISQYAKVRENLLRQPFLGGSWREFDFHPT